MKLDKVREPKYTELLQFKSTVEMAEKLDVLCNRHDITRSDLIRESIELGFDAIEAMEFDEEELKDD